MGRRVAWLLPMAVLLLLLVGCSTKVERMETDEVKDLSGRWNDSDSQMVSEAMIQDCLNHPWLSDYSIRSGQKPDLIVGSIRNRSSEHIATEVFVKDLERALVNSGRANFVASSEERSDVRSERLDQDLNAAPETRNAPGMEAGADFILIGSINSIMDKEKGEKVIFYQVDLELVDMSNNRKVWLGNKKIKKSVSRSSFGF